MSAVRHGWFDRAVIAYSALGNRGLLWVAGGVIAGVATGRYWAIPLVAAVVWITLGLNYAIKRLFRRVRPIERRGRAPLIVAPATPSFPSSHAAMASAGAIALSVYAPVLSPLFATLAVLMAASRVHIGRAPRLRRRGGPCRGRLHGRGLRVAGRLMASLEVGIVGLPNSGKTSLFNALTESHAEITSYAAVQASANVGIAAVPDDRIAALAEAVRPASRCRRRCSSRTSRVSCAAAVPATAASAASTSATCARRMRWHTSCAASTTRRCPIPTAASIPVADAEAVDFELLLSDQALVTRRKERTERAARVGEKSARDELGVLDRLAAHLDEGLPARTLDVEVPEGLDLLTTKPVIYVANVSEAGEPERVAALTAYATEHGAEVVAVAARFEAELAELEDPADRVAFLADLGLDEPGMPRLARACFRTLGLITFFTAGPMEARAWPVREGASRRRGRGQDPLGHRARVHPRRGDPLGRPRRLPAPTQRPRSAASSGSRARTTSSWTATCSTSASTSERGPSGARDRREGRGGQTEGVSPSPLRARR